MGRVKIDPLISLVRLASDCADGQISCRSCRVLKINLLRPLDALGSEYAQCFPMFAIHLVVIHFEFK
jgi:hypothetical protein